MKENNRNKRPHNIEAEQNILGLLLNNNENINKIGDFLTEDHFYLPLHGKIYHGITQLMDRGLVSDPITIKNYFASEKIFQDVQISSYEYLLKLVEEAQLNTDIMTLVKNIYDAYLRRKIIDIGSTSIHKAKQEKIEESGEDIIETMEQSLYDLASSTNYDNKVYSLSDSVRESLAKIEKSLKSNKEISGIDTGYIDLNKFTGGFQNSDLIIIAGRPSMGKTALAVNIVLKAARSYIIESKKELTKKKAICFFSLEMSAEQLASRILAIETKIDGSRIRIGKVSKEEFKTLSSQTIALNDIPLIIDDTPSLTISAIRTKARRMKRQHNIGMIVIDYLQLISSARRNKENRVQEIAEISQGLKAIAKELNIPVITASQLSRAVESREDKRPLLSDLRESGNIEQDADLVMFIYREEYYLSRKIPSSDERKLIEWQEKMEKVGNIAEIIIAKQRNGPVGNFHLRYENRTTSFYNLEN